MRSMDHEVRVLCTAFEASSINYYLYAVSITCNALECGCTRRGGTDSHNLGINTGVFLLPALSRSVRRRRSITWQKTIQGNEKTTASFKHSACKDDRQPMFATWYVQNILFRYPEHRELRLEFQHVNRTCAAGASTIIKENKLINIFSSIGSPFNNRYSKYLNIFCSVS